MFDWLNEGASQQALRVIWGLVVFGIVLFVAKYIGGAVSKVGTKVSRSPAIGNLFGMLVQVVAFFLALFILLKIVGLDGAAMSVLAGAGVVGIIIGFSLQDIAANFIAGIILAIQRPFRVGHLVNTNEVYGIVKRIRLRSTELQTLDGQLVHIPNKNILLDVVSDYNYIPFRRVDLDIGVSYTSDLEKVQRVTVETIQQLKSCDKEHPVKVYFTEFAASSINFNLQFWTAFADEPDYLEARSEAVMAIQKAFAEASIEIPYPITTVLEGSAFLGGGVTS